MKEVAKVSIAHPSTRLAVLPNKKHLDESEALLPGTPRSSCLIRGTIIVHGTIIARLVSVGIRLLCLARTEAGEQHDEHPEEQQNHSCQTCPHSRRVVGVRDVVVVDVVLDDLFDPSVLKGRYGRVITHPEQAEVNGHSHQGQHPCQRCHKRTK